jgi:hypothetical protein
MVVAPSLLRDDYWSTFELQAEDIEFLYNYLLELETPQTSQELTAALVEERIRREKISIEKQRSSGGDLYFPKEHYTIGRTLIFPALNWQRGQVVNVRPGKNPDIGDFEVIQVDFKTGEKREFATGLGDHLLNRPPEFVQDDKMLNQATVLHTYQDDLIEVLESELNHNPDFVRIAGRWFPRTLLVDVNAGHLNLAEAVLDMAGGGPRNWLSSHWIWLYKKISALTKSDLLGLFCGI